MTATIIPLRPLRPELEALVASLPPRSRRPPDLPHVFGALAAALLRPDADPEAVRRRLVAERDLARAETPEQQAAAILARLPDPPELWWHGRDGLPCPCSGCVNAAAQVMAEILAAQRAEEEKQGLERAAQRQPDRHSARPGREP